MSYSWYDTGNVYIVFGDSSRSDGSNIDGVYYCEKDALDAIEVNKKYNPDKEYLCEKHTVWGK